MAADGTTAYLKGIRTISYELGIEKTAGGDGCKIDRESLETSVEFVANQSTRLKIVPPDQKTKRVNELMGYHPGEDKEAAMKAFNDYNFMPFFYIAILPIQTTQFTCAGTINAELWVHLDVENAHVIPTQALMSYPAAVIRQSTVAFWGPPQTFSNQAINAVEQIMKQLVNDWSASQ
jgi:hypothetical protein